MTATLGFLSVLHHADHGYFGGYLIVNRAARPLEFHCTMPVKPSRAQELLYGPTVDDFVCGEQIAKALTGKAKLKPDLVLTDSSAVLAMAMVSDLPVAQLEGIAAQTQGERATCEHLRLPQSAAAALRRITAQEYRFAIPEDSPMDVPRMEELLSGLASNFELSEPFYRVSEALLEAHPVAKAA
ncbi:hypothetical protein [Aureliella helgolandensis]|uniref:Uncharacterized protein n=1 Tax=Aureliella helgolandensis TaxID=2527968 RepID=A0A518G2N7_9BACT|nr:hypothetical protein [Aureliella helgolandensis]QDV22854.1 hypothetical protein Q31a_11460 [Aureliella helgolandensis]